MSKKILVVDDSLTIQKVVSITLNNSPYELEAAHDEEELFAALKKGGFSLVLLDFNLSEESSGYELAKKIKEISPESSIMAMVGTFDSVDEQSLRDAGVDDSIVKPFESTKFVAKCHDLINQTAPSNLAESKDDQVIEESEGWEINTATDTAVHVDVTPVTTMEVPNEGKKSSSLREEIEGWGITMPDIIEAAEIAKDMDSLAPMPPQIDHSQEDQITLTMSEETKVPEQEDLLFPESNSNDDLSDPSVHSKLISLDDLSLSDDYLDEQSDNVGEESIVRAFNDDEDDFWAVDEEADVAETSNSPEETEDIEFTEVSEKIEIGPKLEDATESFSDDHVDHIADRVVEKLKPVIEEIITDKIKAFSNEVVERVAWEAIPDLAENLIKNEVKDLSKKIQEKHSLN